MKHTSPKLKLATSLFSAVALAASAGLAHADIVISDAFNYGGSSNASLSTVLPANSTGLTGNWSYTNGSPSYWNYRPNNGLTFGAYGGTGGSVQFNQSNFAPSTIQRQFSSALTTGTYSLGYLFSIDARGNNGTVGSMLLAASSGANDGNAPVVIAADEFQTDLGGSRITGTTSLNSGSGPAFDGTIYLSLSTVQVTGSSVSIDRYILNLAQFNYFSGLAGGLNANLNQSIATGTGSTNVVQKGTQTKSDATSSLSFLTFNGYANGGQYTLNFDEVRVSNSGGFDSLYATPVPEPHWTAALLVGMVAVAIIRRRRRQALA